MISGPGSTPPDPAAAHAPLNERLRQERTAVDEFGWRRSDALLARADFYMRQMNLSDGRAERAEAEAERLRAALKAIADVMDEAINLAKRRLDQ